MPGPHPLALLHDMWNSDKHRAVSLLQPVTDVEHIDQIPSEFGITRYFKRTWAPKNPDYSAGFSYDDGFSEEELRAVLEEHVRFVFELRLDPAPSKGIPPIGLPLMATLNSLFNTVSSTLDRFDEHFPPGE